MAAHCFQENFWGDGNADEFVSVSGFEAVTNRLKDGKHSSEAFETFLKSRAKLEQIYGKSLAELAKQCSDFTKSASGTSKLAWQKMQQSIKETGNAHTKAGTDIDLRLRSKLSAQSEKQRARRKTLEDDMKKSQGNKAKMYEKVNKMRKTYELKCKEHDKADEDASKATPATKDKMVLRAKKAEAGEQKADSDYKAALAELEESRRSWEVAMENTLSEYEKMETERLELERTLMWKTANMCSALAVISDQRSEEVRQMLEKTDPAADLAEFVTEKGTGIIRPTSIVHMEYAGRAKAPVPPTVAAARNKAAARTSGGGGGGSGGGGGGGATSGSSSSSSSSTAIGGAGRGGAYSSSSSAPASRAGSAASVATSAGTLARGSAAPAATSVSSMPRSSASAGNAAQVRAAPNSTATRPAVAAESRNYQATYDYAPQGPKEMQLTKNDIVTVLDKSHKEWWKVQRGAKKGMVPANYLKPV